MFSIMFHVHILCAPLWFLVLKWPWARNPEPIISILNDNFVCSTKEKSIALIYFLNQPFLIFFWLVDLVILALNNEWDFKMLAWMVWEMVESVLITSQSICQVFYLLNVTIKMVPYSAIQAMTIISSPIFFFLFLFFNLLLPCMPSLKPRKLQSTVFTWNNHSFLQ